MKEKRFRKIKSEIRILGIDDAPFTPHTKDDVLVVGTVFRGGSWLDGVLTTHIKVDGTDSTSKIIEMVKNSRHFDQLGVIMLDGITLGGFNVVDVEKVFKDTGLPIIVVIRKIPDFKRIKKALKGKFEDWERRWDAIKRAGEIYPVKVEDTIYIQVKGIKLEDAIEIVKISTTRSAIPEPIRAAHLIAAGVEKGESKGNA
ncbi:MAG: DUF99 family protein [Methanothermobacter sp.]|nr:DUF99 family protein [Methanothermobacter sp.]